MQIHTMAEIKILIAQGTDSSLGKTIGGIGYTVCSVVRTARQALNNARRLNPDLIIIDTELSGNIDAVKAADLLNKEVNIPIVYISKKNDKKTIKRIMKTRHYGYLPFPFSESMLEYTINTAIERFEKESLLIKEALNITESEWRSFIEYIPTIILKLDLNLNIIYLNRALTGRPLDKIIGTSFYDYVNKSNIKYIRRGINHILKSGESGSYDIYWDELDHPVWFKVDIVPYKRGKKIINLIVVLTDITMRKEAENALKESEEKFRAQYNSFPYPVYTWEFNGKDFVVHGANDAAIKDSKGRIANVFGRKASEIWHNEPDLIRNMHECYEKRTTIKMENVYRFRSTGESQYLSATFAYIPPRFVLIYTEDITESKRALDALRESEKRYRTLQDNIPLGIFRNTVEGKPISVNPYLIKMLGYSDAGDFFKHAAAISAPDLHVNPERREKMISILVSEGSLSNFEAKIIKKDKSEIWVSFNIIAERDKDGNIAFLDGTIEDITERKKAEIALKESEERYRRLVETMDEGILVTDRLDRITYVNNRCCEIFEIPAADFIGKNVIDIMELRSSGVIKKNIDSKRDNNEAQYELIINRPYGTKVINISPHSIFGDNNIFQGSFSVLMDITERKKIEEDLRKSEEIYRTIFENTGTLMVIADKPGNLLLVNDEFAQFSGYSKGELENIMSIFYFFDDKENDNFELNPDKAGLYNDFFPKTYETRLVNKYGQNIDVIVNIHLIAGTDLRVYSMNDITLRKQLEREVLEISMEEQQRIGRDLHDGIGQNLTGIAFMTKVLAKKLEGKGYDESSEASVIVDLINESIEQSRAFSRGLCPVKLNSKNLVPTLKEYALHCEKVFNIECRVKYNSDFKINYDTTALHIYFIVKESVNNAVKHGNAENITITLNAKNGIISIVIADDGTGIPDNFESKEGIGLKIMSYRADLLNGFVEIVRNDNGGTSVKLFFKERNMKIKEGLVYGRA